MKQFLWLAMVLNLFLISVVCAHAGDGAINKLGFGFRAGLTAGKDFVAQQVIIGLKEGSQAGAVAKAVRGLKGRVLKKLETAFLVEFPAEETVTSAVSILSVLPEVLFIERNGIVSAPPHPLRQQSLVEQESGDGDVTTFSVSSDPKTGLQWYQTVIRKTALLPPLSSAPPTVAVLDTGVDYTHPDLKGKVILGKNCIDDNFDPADDDGHGTHAAGIIAAKAGNGSYGEGVCPNCKILAVKVLGPDGGTDFDLACGMQYVRQVAATTNPPTRVINMSLGSFDNSLVVAHEVAAIKTAGMALVAAAGNENSTVPSYPGADPNTALRVMGTEEHDCRTAFSNFSPSEVPKQYNIAAPGWNIMSTLPGKKYGRMDGTSMAAPVVAGAAALLWGQEPTLTRNQLVWRLVRSGKATSCGFAAATRRLDVRKALEGSPETALIGQIIDPATGLAPNSPAYARLFSGSSELASDSMNTSGMYEMTSLEAGKGRSLRGDRSGYATGVIRRNISIVEGKAQGPFTNALPKARPAGDITIVLDWKRIQPVVSTEGCTGVCNGSEFDLVIKMPSLGYVDPVFNPGSLSAPPYVRSPRESSDDMAPAETIIIKGAAENGVYKIFANKWPQAADGIWNPSWTGSGASLRIFKGAAPFGRFYAAPPVDCGNQAYWYIGNLTKTGTNYKWTNVNKCSAQYP